MHRLSLGKTYYITRHEQGVTSNISSMPSTSNLGSGVILPPPNLLVQP